MLRLRILTAAVLLAVLTAALLAPAQWPFACLLLLACTLACWEWLRMTAGPRLACCLSAAFCVVLLAMTWDALSDSLLLTPLQWVAEFMGFLFMAGLLSTFWLCAFACLFWFALAPWLVLRARTERPARSLTLSVLALVLLFTAWWALFLFFSYYGAWYLVSLLALVWVADIAAYFVGRRWGRRKLAAQVSPGKSVEGALAGIGAGVVWMLASGQIAGSIGHHLLREDGFFATVLFAALLVMASIIGDLFESLIKRRAGRKDSSNLLPGHGGVWDRVDAVLPVAPIALLLTSI